MSTSQLKKSALAVAIASAVVLSGCGGSGDGSNTDTSNPNKNPTPQTNLKTVASSPLPKNFTQQLPTPQKKQVKKAIYAKTHRLDLKDVYYKDIAVDGNVIRLNSTYKVGDTVELKDTVLKITDNLGNDTFAVKVAEIFEIFDELEIKTSLPVNTKAPTQTGLLSADDVLKGYNTLKDRNCLPSTQAVRVIGNASLHKTGIGTYAGKQISLKNCKLNDSGSITADAGVSLGMVNDFDLKIDTEKNIYKFKFILDGAMATSGALKINADFDSTLSTTIYTFVPDITKGLPANVAETIKKSFKAEIKLDLITKLDGKFNGETRLQVPADFAFGIEAYYDSKSKKWKYKSYNLNGGKNILMSDTAGLGYNIKETDVKVGSYVALTYDFDLSARLDWNKSENESAFMQWLRDTYEAGTTGSLRLISKSSVQAGLALSARAGTEVPVSQCRANVNAEIGFYSINGFIFRAGAYEEDGGFDNTKNNILTGGTPIVLKTWNLFDAPTYLKKTDWCGKNSKMKGVIADKTSSKIVVTDFEGNVLLRNNYILDWNTPKTLQNGLVAPLAKANPTQLQPIKNEVKLPLPTNTHGVPMNITFKNEKSDVNHLSGEWKYKWVTLNKNLRIENRTSRTAQIYTNCVNECDLDQKANIALFAIAPDGQVRYMSFKPTFATQLSFDAKVDVMKSTMEMYIENTDQSKIQSVQWLTDDGVRIQTSKPNFSVAHFSKFYQSAIKTGKVTATVTDKSGNDHVKVVTFAKPQTGDAEQIKAAVNKLVGYWKTTCKQATNGSKYYYKKFAAVNNDSLKVVKAYAERFTSNDCTGKPKFNMENDSLNDVVKVSDATQKGSTISAKLTLIRKSEVRGTIPVNIKDSQFTTHGSNPSVYNKVSANQFPSG